MIEKMAISLVEQMSREKMIAEYQTDYYIYVLISGMERFITVGTILMISILVNKLIYTIFFLIFFLSLRKRTGGFHCNTFFQCYFATVLMYVFILIVSPYCIMYPRAMFLGVAIAVYFILKTGTVNHPNMNMNEKELKETKKAARILIVFESIIIFYLFCMGIEILCLYYLAMAIILCATLLGIAKIMKQEVAGNEEN